VVGSPEPVQDVGRELHNHITLHPVKTDETGS
jgi:hypothetical protein